MVPEDAVEAPGGVRAWSADVASGLVGEPAGAGESADPAAGVGRGGSVCAEGCSTWCLDGLDGRD